MVNLNPIGLPGGMSQRMALIRYYLHKSPESIDEFAQLWNELAFALQFDGKLKVTEKVKG